MPLILFISASILTYKVKPYIIIAFLPSAFLWWIWLKIDSSFNSKIIKPLAIILTFIISIFILRINEKQLNNIATKAKITADWVYYKSNKDGGSSYNIGELDGTFLGMLKVLPSSVNVTLYRPYIFEVKNIVMLLSSLESTALLFLTLYLIALHKPSNFFNLYFKNPFLLFCLVFSIVFAFAIGSSTYNFGSLVRYKIPLLPFFTFSLLKILKSKN